jgi:hypothetical protein
MATLLKVTLEFDDHTRTLEGPEAQKWQQHTDSLATLGHYHNMNPFDQDPVVWQFPPKSATP